jgi:hypothetical protein
MARILASLASLLLTACVQSPIPLESGERVTDAALTGTWKAELHGDPMVATFRQEKDGNLTAEVLAWGEPGPTASTQHYEIVLAKFGTQRYMSIREKGVAPDYSLARYVVVDRDRFCVFATFSDQLSADVERKVLPGRVLQDRHMTAVELAASAGQLRDYFSRQGKRAFNEQDEVALVFQRATSAELPPPPEPPEDPDSIVPTRCRR